MTSRRVGNEIMAALAGVVSLGTAVAGASAEDTGHYPTKPITMIVPFAPGGASDFVARIIQPRVGEILGEQIGVDNRPGAGGIIGTEIAAPAAPDGSTAF